MAGYWLKLYVEILDDSKYFRLSDAARAGMFELMLVAKRFENDGILPPLPEIAFQTRRSEDWWQPVIKELGQINFLIENDGVLKIRKFEERQSAIPSTERSRQHRKVKHSIGYAQRNGNDDATDMQRNVMENRGETEEIRTDTETEQTTPVVVSKKKKEKIPLKSQAASMLVARHVSNDTLKELIDVYRPEMIMDYCHAYDQATKDGVIRMAVVHDHLGLLPCV